MTAPEQAKDAAQAKAQAQAQAKAKAMDELARKIIHYTRRYISSAVPILLLPVYVLKEQKVATPIPMGTDGVHLFYNPEQVIRGFRQHPPRIILEFLHVTLHCLLGHLPKRKWNLAPFPIFDALSDYQINEFVRHILPSLARGLGSYCRDEFELYHELFENTTLMGACSNFQHVNPTLSNNQKKRMKKQAKILAVDDHKLWSNPKWVQAQMGNSPQQADGTINEAAVVTLDATDEMDKSFLVPDWEEMLKTVMEQAAQSTQWGDFVGKLKAAFDPAEDSGIRYVSFLKQFAHIRERMFTDPDSIDVRWYTTGLRLYGNVPLLEPLEIAEPPSPDDLVIALDTSGSCSGDICRRFLRETLNLLRDITAGLSSFRVLLLQCDTEIQQELFLETPDQIDSLPYDFSPSGFGGTDFCPVFERIAERQSQGVLPRVRGLLYLSDAFGEFPDTAPDYPTVFLIPEEESNAFGWAKETIPDWVTALYLSPHDFTIKEPSKDVSVMC